MFHLAITSVLLAVAARPASPVPAEIEAAEVEVRVEICCDCQTGPDHTLVVWPF